MEHPAFSWRIASLYTLQQGVVNVLRMVKVPQGGYDHFKVIVITSGNAVCPKALGEY